MARYQLFYERWNNHAKSRQICAEGKGKLLEKVALLHEVMNYPPNELEFFDLCAETIIKCR